MGQTCSSTSRRCLIGLGSVEFEVKVDACLSFWASFLRSSISLGFPSLVHELVTWMSCSCSPEDLAQWAALTTPLHQAVVLQGYSHSNCVGTAPSTCLLQPRRSMALWAVKMSAAHICVRGDGWIILQCVASPIRLQWLKSHGEYSEVCCNSSPVSLEHFSPYICADVAKARLLSRSFSTQLP